MSRYPAAPDPDDYLTEDDYQDALAAYENEMALREMQDEERYYENR